MTAAMMLPSAAPFVFSFARGFRREPVWPLALVLLLVVYLAVWTVFGVGLLAVSGWVPPWVAIGVAVVYMFTPLRKAGEAGCEELCRRFEGAPGGAARAALVRGSRYGLCCVGCTAGVMVAVFYLGMSDLRLILAGAVAVFLLKVRGWFVVA
jgi:predicted metal-binding membrane protein